MKDESTNRVMYALRQLLSVVAHPNIENATWNVIIQQQCKSYQEAEASRLK